MPVTSRLLVYLLRTERLRSRPAPYRAAASASDDHSGRPASKSQSLPCAVAHGRWLVATPTDACRLLRRQYREANSPQSLQSRCLSTLLKRLRAVSTDAVRYRVRRAVFQQQTAPTTDRANQNGHFSPSFALTVRSPVSLIIRVPRIDALALLDPHAAVFADRAVVVGCGG
jgi:hypothetical protein